MTALERSGGVGIGLNPLFGGNSARFSPCRRYRYELWRRWDESKPYAMFVGLNPSTADEVDDDPTIRRCIRFARDWGFGALCMTNLFALRATDPKVMLAHSEPEGPENDQTLLRAAYAAGIVIAAWGAHGGHRERDQWAQWAMLNKLHHLGLTKDGKPRHPLYLRADTRPQPLTPNADSPDRAR